VIAESEQPLVRIEQRNAPWLARYVQRDVPLVELVASSLESPVLVRQLWLDNRRVRMQGGSHGLGNLSFARHTAVQIEDQIVEAHLLEALEHGIDRGPFLSDEQDSLAAGHQRGDEVGDRLTLARSGWALDNEVLAGENLVDGVVLRR